MTSGETRTLRGGPGLPPGEGRPGEGQDPPPWPSGWRGSIRPLAVAGAVVVAVYVIAGLSVAHLPFDPDAGRAGHFPGYPFLEAWVHWDAGWYFEIAERGYSYVAGEQGPVAFFPAYGLAMRFGGWVVGSPLLAGILVTLASGLASAVLFHAWVRERRGPVVAATALLVLLVYPYSFFLYGAVYADALFLACILGAFVLVEHDRPVLAGLVGAVATAARPLGIVVVVGLLMRTAERRGGWGRLRRRDAGVMLAGLGLGAFCLFLWVRFGNPLLFAEVQEAWGQSAGPRTWFKVQFFSDVTNFTNPLSWIVFMAHPVVTIGAFALVPGVFRRYGRAYGTFSVLVLALAAISTQNFFGMARYVLGAFPVFAVAGEMLSDRPRLRVAALSAGAVGLALTTSFFSRAYYLS